MPVKKHLGFKKTQAKIAKKQGISKASAGAILASSARKASPAAVKKNPALKNVPGVKKYVNGGWVQEVIKTAQNRKKKEGNKTISSSRKHTDVKLGKDTYGTSKAFRATKSGKLVSETTQDFPTRGGGMLFDKTTTVMDTTGYSKGKKSFPAKRTNYNPFDTDLLTGEQREVKTQTFDVPRNKVKKTIKEMKSNTGMLQKEKAAKLKQKPKAPVSTKTVIDRNGKKTTKTFKPVRVNKSEAFKKGGKK